MSEKEEDINIVFLEAVEKAYQFICEHPDAGSYGNYRTKALAGIRRWLVPGFENHLVFYRHIDDCVEVVRVLHGARDIEALFDA